MNCAFKIFRVGLVIGNHGHLLDLEKLDVEDKLAVGGDARQSLAAVGKMCGNTQTTLATDGHAGNTDIPSLDDLTLAELEGKWGSLLVCCISS